MIIIKRDVFIIELNSASLCIQIRYIRLSKIIFIQNHELLRSLVSCPRSKRIYDIQFEFISDTTRRISILPNQIKIFIRAIPLFVPSAAFDQTAVSFRHAKFTVPFLR